MQRLLVSVILLATLATVQSGEHCDDFEAGGLGPFWSTSDLDSRGAWKVASYQDLKSSIPDFPAPAQGDAVAYLTGNSEYEVYIYSRLQMTDEYVFPPGSTLSFRYWLRTDYPGSGTLEARQQIRGVEEKEPFISLGASSGPNNTDWMDVSALIPDSSYEQKIIIFGGCAPHVQSNNIAVDDVKICGPSGMDQKCYAVSTSTELPTTTTETTTTELPTTSEAPTTTERSTSPAPPSPSEYCDDFETDDFGVFWGQSGTGSGGRWTPSSYASLQASIPDFPAPASGDTVVYLTPSAGSGYVSARLQMTSELVFPEGSSVSFRYWLRSQYPGSGTLLVRRAVGQHEDVEPLLDLTAQSGPQNGQWREASVQVPASDEPATLIIFGACGTQAMDNIAMDDIRVCGPISLHHECVPLSVSWY